LLACWGGVIWFRMPMTTNGLGTKMNFGSLLAFLLFAIPGTTLAADGPEFTSAPAAICADCHGKDGASTQPDVPIIGGLSALALEEDLFAFRDGVRPCRTTSYRAGVPDRPTTDMCRISADLSDDEIVQIAAFYAAKAFVPASEQLDSDNVTRGEKIHKELGCVLCHGKGGSDPADDAGILAGQWTDYLTTALVDFRTGKRWIPKNMETKFRNLTDQDIEALAHFYGSEGYRHQSN
jgi:sulfide dehydrogenase cytochrome subunit